MSKIATENHQRQLKRKGDIGESMARKLLERKGFRFLGANVHSRYGELDLIMWDGDELVFVEVKLRFNTAFGRGEDAITNTKAKKMILTINEFLQKNNLEDTFWRIDLVCIEKQENEWVAFHSKDAIRDVYWGKKRVVW